MSKTHTTVVLKPGSDTHVQKREPANLELNVECCVEGLHQCRKRTQNQQTRKSGVHAHSHQSLLQISGAIQQSFDLSVAKGEASTAGFRQVRTSPAGSAKERVFSFFETTAVQFQFEVRRAGATTKKRGCTQHQTQNSLDSSLGNTRIQAQAHGARMGVPPLRGRARQDKGRPFTFHSSASTNTRLFVACFLGGGAGVQKNRQQKKTQCPGSLTSMPKMPERFSLFRSSLALNLCSSSASSSTACLATS